MKNSIKIENLSKRYRIGLKDEYDKGFFTTIGSYITSPWANFKKYRALYSFKENENLHDDKHNASTGVFWALKDINLEVNEGEIIGVIGQNGAGKSTLLKILSRITHPTTGMATIRGRISSLLEVGTGFHKELTGRENIFLNGTILGMRKEEIKKKFDQIVDFSGVEKFLDTPVKRYSSGMSVRLAFSVAAHLDPDVLIIDEVLAVGDADFQKKCLNTMQNVGESGRTVLFVSHNMPAITRLCTRTILLDKGKIIQDGNPATVIKNYLSKETGSISNKRWKDVNTAPTGTHARPHSVRVKDWNDKTIENIDIRKTFGIEIVWEVFKDGLELKPHIGIRNGDGQLIFTSIDIDPEWNARKRPVGMYKTTSWIPGNLMAEGIFYVYVYLFGSDRSRQFAIQPAVSFSIVDTIEGDSARGDYGGTFFGVVRPKLNWTTEFMRQA